MKKLVNQFMLRIFPIKLISFQKIFYTKIVDYIIITLLKWKKKASISIILIFVIKNFCFQNFWLFIDLNKLILIFVFESNYIVN